jgi:prepilin-type processing-associated H-X9-DG protein
MSAKPKAFGCKEDWIVIVIILVLILWAVYPAFNSHRPNRRIHCASNLKQIGLSLKQYSMDYADFFPPNNNAQGLEKLRSLDYLTDYGVYVCPETRTTKRTGTVPLSDKICDYIYLGGSKEGDDPTIPLAFDKPSNHTNYINVLFLDGHVMGYPVTGLTNCESVIIFLQAKNKYSPKLFKKLSDKAKKIDGTLGL